METTYRSYHIEGQLVSGDMSIGISGEANLYPNTRIMLLVESPKKGPMNTNLFRDFMSKKWKLDCVAKNGHRGTCEDVRMTKVSIEPSKPGILLIEALPRELSWIKKDSG